AARPRACTPGSERSAASPTTCTRSSRRRGWRGSSLWGSRARKPGAPGGRPWCPERRCRPVRGAAPGARPPRARPCSPARFPPRMDTASDVADLLVGIERFDLGLDYPARFRQGVAAVTADDVLRAVRTHWNPDAMSLALVGDLRAAGIAGP